MEATRAAGKSGSRLGFPGHGARVREGVATECGRGSGAGGKRKADPQGLALILIFRWCTLAGMMGKGGGGDARCRSPRAGGAAASAHTVQAERAAEAMRRNGWRGEARRAIRAGAWPERRREGLKPAGPGQPAGPVRSTKARRRSRHAKVSPCDTARESQSPEHGARLRRLSACRAPGSADRAPCRRSRRRSSLPALASARCGNARTRRTTGRHPSACARSCGVRSAGKSVSSRG